MQVISHFVSRNTHTHFISRTARTLFHFRANLPRMVSISFCMSLSVFYQSSLYTTAGDVRRCIRNTMCVTAQMIGRPVRQTFHNANCCSKTERQSARTQILDVTHVRARTFVRPHDRSPATTMQNAMGDGGGTRSGLLNEPCHHHTL